MSKNVVSERTLGNPTNEPIFIVRKSIAIMRDSGKYHDSFSVVLWMIVIFMMSTRFFSFQNTSLFIEPLLHFFMPGLSQIKITIFHTLIRKGAHIAEYFILGLLLFRFFRNDSTDSKVLRRTISAMIVVVLYAASDEFHQSFVATRTASLIDIGIDVSGGLLAQLVSGFGLLFWQR